MIVSIDEEPVADVSGVLTRLRRYDPGDTITLTLVAAGEQRTVEVTLADR